MIRLNRAAIGLALGLCASSAWAELEICNGTDARHSLAIGYKDGDDWVSEGWWGVDAGDCVTPIKDDLRYRYYYFRVSKKGRTFVDEKFMFCTDPDVFTIVGDEDCADRGYDRAGFRRIDTGAKSLSHSYTFDASVSQPEETPPEPEPAPVADIPADTADEPPADAPDDPPAADPKPPAPKETANEAGKWGEPYYSSTAVFQECIYETEAPFCTFHADGTKFFVYRDGRTPDYIFESLDNHLPGTPIEVEGDLAEIFDRTAEVVLRSAVPRKWNSWDNILDKLQGAWYSTDYPDDQFTVLGSELTRQPSWTIEYLSLTTYCDGAEGGEYLRFTEEDSGESICYAIEALEDFRLELMYLPRANFHEFRKLD